MLAFRMNFELTESFGLILCYVYKYNCTIFKSKNNFQMTIVGVFDKIISIPNEELLSETAIGCTTSYFV